ncbi:MAG: hypothetical protein GC152_07115 [Alphaproteobacteria bacterium]|nr:hypothetical protein [Alphaproteobacteria bacterium]
MQRRNITLFAAALASGVIVAAATGCGPSRLEKDEALIEELEAELEEREAIEEAADDDGGVAEPR